MIGKLKCFDQRVKLKRKRFKKRKNKKNEDQIEK